MAQPNHKSTRSKTRRRTKPAGAVSAKDLLSRVRAAERSLRAIPLRDVDAVVVSGGRGARVVTLKGGEPAYRMLVEAMSEGAATVSSDGVLLYCNRRLAELMEMPASRLIGAMLPAFAQETDQDRLARFIRTAPKQAAKGEFKLRTGTGKLLPVQVSLNTLGGYGGKALSMVISDLTEQRRHQKEEIRRAKSTHRLILGREILAQEAERQRIARELHDEAGQLMTSLLVALRQMDDAKDLTECREMSRRLRQLTAQAIDEVGRLARGLHPIALDDHGLVAALSRYVEEYSKTHGIAVTLSLDELYSSRLTAVAQVALYRIIQEALTNVAKHAGAKKVKVVCHHAARVLELAVIDDGRGFDFNRGAMASNSTSHLGLQSIRERSALLGGTASFLSTGKGAEVRVRIPIHSRELTSGLKRRNS